MTNEFSHRQNQDRGSHHLVTQQLEAVEDCGALSSKSRWGRRCDSVVGETMWEQREGLTSFHSRSLLGLGRALPVVTMETHDTEDENSEFEGVGNLGEDQGMMS